MSTGDYVRYLRAMKGGPTPQEVEEASGVTAGMYRQMEQRYRSIGSEEDLAKLAEYYGVPVEEFTSRVPWSRKALSAALVEAREADAAITLTLRNGDTLTGKVLWSDLGAALIRKGNGKEIVVQRHFVDRWETQD